MRRVSEITWLLVLAVLVAEQPVCVSSQYTESTTSEPATTTFEPSTTVKLTSVIYRHGARTPADTYPNDPHINYTFYPTGWGQLTNEGKQQQYDQGRFLRERYDGLLGDLYSPTDIYVQATDVDRTLMSAQLELAGLYSPPSPSQQWNADIGQVWHPIPVHTVPLKDDKLLLVRADCPRYYVELDKASRSPEVLEISAMNADLYDHLTRHSGMNISCPDDVQSLYSTLYAEELCNLTLPEWTRAFYPDMMLPLTAFSFVLNCYNQEMQRLKGGPLLKDIVQHMKQKVDGTLKPDRKMFMYAGHDSTVANLLIALNLFESQIPNYNAMVMVELSENSEGQHGVQVFFRNDTTRDPYLLVMPGCEPYCPLEKFLELTASVIPENWEQECEVDDPSIVPPRPETPP